MKQKIIFCASVRPFHHKSCQYHHSNYLKVIRMSATPQTRNLHARPSVGQPLQEQCNVTPSRFGES